MRIFVSFVLCAAFLWSIANGISKDFTCHDPDVGGSTQNNDRRFLIIGSDDSVGAGLGNLLIFFPAAYYFAAFTGRDIIISDRSTIGELCHILKCGFPFVSEMALAYPGILTPEAIGRAREIKKQDFQKHEEGAEIEDLVVRAWGYKPESDWWVYFGETTQCVAKFTSCDLGDVTCAERHAYQRLIRGPFISDLSVNEEERIHGVPENIKHSILALPHAFAPRFDAAIHLRTQFASFERQDHLNSTESKAEVQEWLHGEGKTVFEHMESKLLEEIGADRLHRTNHTLHHGIISPLSGNATAADPIYVYLAADNEEVKEALAQQLEQKHDDHYEIKVMRVRTNGIFHVKNLAKMKDLSQGEGVMDMVFDWYALSLANVVLAWRKGGTHLVSTFVHSAARLSGTTARTSYKKELGKGGVGTLGTQLQQNKHGGYFWNPFWLYGFLEDYAIPEDRRNRYRSRHKF
eukprot:GSChrysophyteH1.ASY1.ANO1.1576.1 assembled CDS